MGLRGRTADTASDEQFVTSGIVAANAASLATDGLCRLSKSERAQAQGEYDSEELHVCDVG